jgi:predicted transcriptional regulator
MIFSNKRCETEIISQILSSANKGIKKTRLQYQTNLCYTLFTEYLNFLRQKRFIGVEKNSPSGDLYYTTKEGAEFLKSIKYVLSQVK